jgi:hypothetical protein
VSEPIRCARPELLGVVLLALHLLEGMGALGWWTQWLVIAAFWWIVFAHRHRVFEVATMIHARTGARTMSTTSRVIAAHRLATIAGDAALPARRLAGARTTRRAARRRRGATPSRRRTRTDPLHNRLQRPGPRPA